MGSGNTDQPKVMGSGNTEQPKMKGSGNTDQPPSMEYRHYLMKYFKNDHLPKHLKVVSEKFSEVARYIEVMLPECAESSAALRKLLESKDCAVRAALDLKD